MAVVKGIKEVIHLPLYDSIYVKPRDYLGRTQSSNVLRFFQDVTGKTKLQTNMQAASLLPHWNTFEARALRVVISDLAAQFPDNPTITWDFDLNGVDPASNATPKAARLRKVTLANISLRHFVEFKRLIEANDDITFDTQKDLDCLGLMITENGQKTVLNPTVEQRPSGAITGEMIVIDRSVLCDLEKRFRDNSVMLPPNEQICPHNGFGSLIGRFIYNSVTTFYVGEKVMIQVPTWFFPAGAGPYSEDGRVTTHGYPNPEATFRFAEPINIETQQNFRVEIEIPENEVLSDLQRLYGPFFIWVTVDGFMTRDVQ
jgi:hypothetical protein